MANVVRTDYEALAEAAKGLNAEADRVRQIATRLDRGADNLKRSSWTGKGAEAFYRELEGSILPCYRRLEAALKEAGQTMTALGEMFQQAEQEAAGYLRMTAAGGPGDDGAGPGSDGDSGTGSVAGQGGGGPAGAAGQAGGAVGGGAGQAPDWQQRNPLLVRDPNSLFKDDYMHSLIGSQFQGADSAELRQAMNDLSKNPTGAELDQTLQRIADLRGRPVADIRADYDKYLQVRQQRDATNPNRPDDLNILHPEFMGSTSQLRYGKVVGDAFGVDPVFGAMLNPTGGLVGPDNWAVDGDSTALGYHGMVHDAAGYLYNYHHEGPGYDYLGREGRATSSPLSGQREGIRYWRQTLPGSQPGSTAGEYVMRGVVGAADGYNWLADKYSQIKSIF